MHFSGEEEKLFASGEFTIEGETKPLKPVQFKKKSDKTCELILTEGRYHQIKKMFEKLDNEVVKLHRVQIGSLKIDDVDEGQWRYVSPAEINNLGL